MEYKLSPIKSEEELHIVQTYIKGLMNKDSLSDLEMEYLKDLNDLIINYESEDRLILDIYGGDLIRLLLSDNDLEPDVLVPLIGPLEYVMDVIDNKVELKQEDIEVLGSYFNIPPMCFKPLM